ncbi:hypothetical protein Mucpa_4308 [Mucilaginibacter paludis DSM 18603]|uniref:Uncharacterized protein n=1 Tax=Mucilaginibacter paludis DSM 18603 TaxID=714943 RepID=H1Y6Z1_9SPHI|nr:hypothetical protein Mucpa_4308 [Mucilaginibacter paludis DSM 18603]
MNQFRVRIKRSVKILRDYFMMIEYYSYQLNKQST